MNSLDILASAAVELLGAHEAAFHIMEPVKEAVIERDQEAAKRVLRSVKVSAFVAKLECQFTSLNTHSMLLLRVQVNVLKSSRHLKRS